MFKKVVNTSDKNVVMPSSIKNKIPFIQKNDSVTVDLEENEINLLFKLSSLGIVVMDVNSSIEPQQVSSQALAQIQALTIQLEEVTKERDSLIEKLANVGTGDNSAVIGEMQAKIDTLEDTVMEKEAAIVEKDSLLVEANEKLEKSEANVKKYKDAYTKLKGTTGTKE